MMYIDLVNFKSINDSYGMVFGDQVLRACARAISDVVAVRGVVSRIGSDHFIILYQYNHEDEIEITEERIRRALAHIHEVDDTEVTIYPNVGSALFEETEDVETLRRLAIERLK